MAKQQTYQKYIYKIHSRKILHNKKNLVLSLPEMRRAKELVSLADSQVLRFIDDINGVNVNEVNEKISEIRNNIKRLRLEVKNADISKIKQIKNEIKNHYDELDVFQNKPDYLAVIMDNPGVREQGYDVVSVPNGLGNKGLTFLDDNDIDLLATYPSVIIFGDSENGKITLVEEFEEKLEREVRVIADYKGKKDANEILTGCGKEILLQLVKESKIYEDSEIKHISDVDLSEDTRSVLFVTGFPETDNMLNGIESGNLILLLGKEGSGKTTIATQMLLQAANSKIKSMVYSGEMTLRETAETLYLQAAGPQYTDRLVNDRTKKNFGVVKPFARDKIGQWLNQYILLYEDKTIRKDQYEKVYNPSALVDRMLTVVERQIKHSGVKFVVIDNMMSALARYSEGGELYGAQAELALHLNFLCKKYDITILLCVHARKTDKASLHLFSDDISGSSIPKNMSDIILSYEKYHPLKKGKKDDKDDDNPPSGYLRVLKNRHWGALTKYDSEGEEIYYAALCRRLFAHDDFDNLRNGKPYPQYNWLSDNS